MAINGDIYTAIDKESAAVPFRDGAAVLEGRAGEREVLRCLHVGAGPDEGVVSGVSIAERTAEGVGHGSLPSRNWLGDP
jgi:hypothetical protein